MVRIQRFEDRSSRRIALSLAACASLVIAAGCGQADSPAPDIASEGPTPMDADTAESTQIESSGFMYKDIPVAKDSVESGEGQQVTMQGTPVALKGSRIQVGDRLPEATLKRVTQETASLGEGKGRVRILSIVPALGTPTCEQQTHYLSEKNGGLDEELELLTISLDTPEQQEEFALDAEIENVTFLSDAESAEFGTAAGLLIEQPRILARAVIVVDDENVVRYMQVVPEITKMPDMDAAFAFARELVSKTS